MFRIYTGCLKDTQTPLWLILCSPGEGEGAHKPHPLLNIIFEAKTKWGVSKITYYFFLNYYIILNCFCVKIDSDAHYVFIHGTWYMYVHVHVYTFVDWDGLLGNGKVTHVCMWSVMAERSSALDSSSGVVRMWVWIPACPVTALVSLSKTLNHNCFVLRMGRKAIDPVCCVMHVKEPRTCPGVSGFILLLALALLDM